MSFIDRYRNLVLGSVLFVSTTMCTAISGLAAVALATQGMPL